MLARTHGLCLQFEPSDVEECAQGKIPPLLAGITHSQQRKWSSLLRRERELASCRMKEEGRLLFVSGFNCANMIKECQKERRAATSVPMPTDELAGNGGASVATRDWVALEGSFPP